MASDGQERASRSGSATPFFLERQTILRSCAPASLVVIVQVSKTSDTTHKHMLSQPVDQSYWVSTQNMQFIELRGINSYEIEFGNILLGWYQSINYFSGGTIVIFRQ